MVTVLFAVVTVSVESPLYEVIESSSVATICLRKDAETGRPLPVVMQPLEITPTLPDVFQARGTYVHASCDEIYT